MAVSFAVPTPTTSKLTTEQILECMPHSSANELQGIHKELYSAYQALSSIGNGQLIRLLSEEARRPFNDTLALLRHAMPALEKAIAPRREQEAKQQLQTEVIEQALTQAFPELAATTPANPAALLQVIRWMLIAKTEMYFSCLLTMNGHLDFFEQEQTRFLYFLSGYIFESCLYDDKPLQTIKPSIAQTKKRLSRPLNKTETAVFKCIQEELAVELSNNVVRLNSTRKPVKQGEHA